MYYYYNGNLKTRKCITLCSYRIAVQFGTAAMRYTLRSLLEGEQPQLCRECLGQTGDVNELKSGKINIKPISNLRNNVSFKSDSKSVVHTGNLVSLM